MCTFIFAFTVIWSLLGSLHFAFTLLHSSPTLHLAFLSKLCHCFCFFHSILCSRWEDPRIQLKKARRATLTMVTFSWQVTFGSRLLDNLFGDLRARKEHFVPDWQERKIQVMEMRWGLTKQGKIFVSLCDTFSSFSLPLSLFPKPGIWGLFSKCQGGAPWPGHGEGGRECRLCFSS